MKGRRVVVTGLGLVSPLGNNVQTSWDALLAGKSGIGPVTAFDAKDLPTRFAGLVKEFDVTQYIPAKEARRVSDFIQYAIAAASDCVQDAAIDLDLVDLDRCGVCVGSGIGGIGNIESQHQVLLSSGPKKVSPFFVPGTINNMAAGNISILLGFRGPNLCITTACATGAHSIGIAARMIALGEADVMLAGGAEKGSTYLGIAGFSASRALSRRNEAPELASRPWDKERDGFVLGDGASVIALESLDHAQARGARIYAELAGFGMNGDAYHMTAPLPEGTGAAKAMQLALQDAQISVGEVDYINAHGTSTLAGDLAEVMAVKSVFGQGAYKVCISSTKSMVGHMLGAAGAAEAVFTILAIKHNIVPPTINLDNPDDQCDLDFTPHKARVLPVNVGMSNSFGFGGTNACLVFRRFE